MATRPLPDRSHLIRTVLRNLMISVAMVVVALSAGAVGWHIIEGADWVDAFFNAAMLLTGMGLGSPVKTVGGKVFASLYAMFSGLFFLTLAAVLFGPVAHRLLHQFHLELDEED